jgi:hypothetical protein
MDAIIAYAGQQGMRMILDHHRSGAGAGTSDNGLWYDGTYTEDAWVADWVTLANRYKTDSTVIGFDLHNEPHNGTWGGGGATDWARAAERAGNAALAVNPNLLMFVEGVGTYQGQSYWWGGNLMGVKDRPIVFNVANRLVYSPHDYPNSVFPQTWFQTADFGAGLPAVFRKAWGYIYEQNIAPIYIGEFGTKLTDPKDAIWLEAITSYISGDLDNNGTKDIAAGNQGINWTFWSWNPNSGDTGGILADDWKTVNQNKMAYLTPVQFSAAGGSSLAAFTVALSSASATAVTVAFVGFIESIAVAKMYAVKHGYDILPSSELKALGVTNMLGACVVHRHGGSSSSRRRRENNLLKGGDAFAYFRKAVSTHRAVTTRTRDQHQFLQRRTSRDRSRKCLVRYEQLKHPNATGKSGATTARTASTACKRAARADEFFDRRTHRRIWFVQLAAVRTNASYETLRENATHNRRDKKRLDADIDQARDGTRCIIRVQRRENKVPGERRLHCCLRSFAVANLAHHDHIGILAEHRAQRRRKRKACFVVHLELIHARQRCLDRIFNRRDVSIGSIQT